MARMACISIPQPHLQIVLHRHPEWRDTPVVVVTEDKPLGRITQVNRRAYEEGVRVGMRYATALTMQPMLRAGTVDSLDLDSLEHDLYSICNGFSPVCESASLAPGVFWIDASGIEGLFESEYRWARALVSAIHETGYGVRCAVGTTRRGTFCAAVSIKGITVFDSQREETDHTHASHLEVLPLDEIVLLRLRHLGVTTIGGFLDLPGADIRSRFGESAFALHLFLSRGDPLPLQPAETRVVCTVERRFQEGVAGTGALLAVLSPMFDTIASRANRRGLFFNRLDLDLFDEENGLRRETISPAEPTRSRDTVFRLLKLRLEAVRLETPVYRCVLSGNPVTRDVGQRLLIGSTADRDGRRAGEVFALIRAELGNDAIRVPVLKHEHDPQRRVEWITLPAGRNPFARRVSDRDRRIGEAAHDSEATPVLCRRVLEAPQPHHPRNEQTIAGPFRLTGAWWEGEVEREYRFTSRGNHEIYWSFREDDSPAVYLQGWVG